MTGISYVCPNCSASITIDTQRGYSFCPYCGTQVFSNVEKSNDNPNINITINATPTNTNKVAELDNFIRRAVSFENNKQYEEAEYYYNRALDVDATSQVALAGMHRVQSIITKENLFIKRGAAFSVGEIPVSIILDGKKFSHIKPNSNMSLIIPVGKHTLVFKRASITSKPINLEIESNKVYYEITVSTGVFKITTDSNKYRRREILH